MNKKVRPRNNNRFSTSSGARSVSLSPLATVTEWDDSHVSDLDSELLERARAHWKLGEWENLVGIDCRTLEHHPDRAKLALLVAAGHQALGNLEQTRQHTQLASSWGCSKALVSRILLAGVHNSLGRAAALSSTLPGDTQTQELRAQQAARHFHLAIGTGVPGADVPSLTQRRTQQQLGQLGFSPDTASALMPRLGFQQNGQSSTSPANQSLKAISSQLEALDKQVAEHSKKQSDELIRVRKYLESLVKKEVLNAVKQIEAFAGLQNYFATGRLPPSMHGWPISPDLGLYLIELLESQHYDLVIEFGSGTSTVLIAQCLALKAARQAGQTATVQVAFEHLEQYHAQTLTQLQYAGLDSNVQLVHAPLEPYLARNGNTYSYYRCNEKLASLSEKNTSRSLCILVLVDGPPAAVGPEARYPALPFVQGHFQGAAIDFLLDDYIREDEKAIAQQWLSELRAQGIEPRMREKKLEKDACLISI